MGAALNYEHDLDFSKPLSEQWGGRFLTKPEIDEIHRSFETGAYEYVAMNIKRLSNVARDVGGTAITADDLVVLLELSQDLERFAELFTRLAGTVNACAWDLWHDETEAAADASRHRHRLGHQGRRAHDRAFHRRDGRDSGV